MAAWNYEACHAKMLVHEGGYSNHPDDPGGVTLEGVTQAVYDAFRKKKGLPRKALSASMRTTAAWIAERQEIYRARYWDVLRCDELPAGLDYAVFDYGVNSGVSRSAKALQRVVGVADDGIVGPVTLGAAQARDCRSTAAALCDERLRFLRALRTWRVFGKGWGRRVAEVKEAALAMVQQDG
jgi:lysozyme family protein